MISGGVIYTPDLHRSLSLHPATSTHGHDTARQCPHDVVKSGNRVPLAAQTVPQCLGGYRIISQQGSNPGLIPGIRNAGDVCDPVVSLPAEAAG
jgi:hypothetical protein